MCLTIVKQIGAYINVLFMQTVWLQMNTACSFTTYGMQVNSVETLLLYFLRIDTF
jgi:hypothetical protein